MKEHEKKNAFMLKISLYLISLWILFLMIIVLKMERPEEPFAITWENVLECMWDNYISCICMVLILLGALGYILFLDTLKNAKELPVEISECESINYENLSFLATYVMPLVCFPLEKHREVLVMFVMIFVIGCIFVKTNLYYTNPSLVLLGFNIYKIKTNGQAPLGAGIVIIQGRLSCGDVIKYLHISDNVYYGRKVKNANRRN